MPVGRAMQVKKHCTGNLRDLDESWPRLDEHGRFFDGPYGETYKDFKSWDISPWKKRTLSQGERILLNNPGHHETHGGAIISISHVRG